VFLKTINKNIEFWKTNIFYNRFSKLIILVVGKHIFVIFKNKSMRRSEKGVLKKQILF